MARLPWALRVLFALALVFPAVAGAATIAPVAVTAEQAQDLSRNVETCASAPEATVEDIVAGACEFVPASAALLAPGFSPMAHWLRLTLVNPSGEPVERLLRIGFSRLSHVSFFEAANGGWRRQDTGSAVPMTEHLFASPDALLGFTLAPGESRLVLVRVSTGTLVNLTPVLWQKDAYVVSLGKRIGIGAFILAVQLTTFLFTLIIFLYWKDTTYLHFALSSVTIAIFSAVFSGVAQSHLWPATWPFDSRIPFLALALNNFFVAQFARGFIGSFRRYPTLDILLAALAIVSLVTTLWTALGLDKTVALAILASALSIKVVTVALYYRAFRDGFRIAGLMLFAALVVIGGTAYFLTFDEAMSDLGRLTLILEFLISAPIGVFAIAVHREELESRLVAAERLSAERVEFLARMSHELRTPLDTILGTAQLLSRSPSPHRLAEGLNDIRDGGRHLLKMIDEILDHARGLAGRLTLVPETIDWPRFMRGVEHNARVLAERNGNTFLLDVGGEAIDGLIIDGRRLRQVLDNLIANAARHTKAGTIRVGCQIGETDSHGNRRLDFVVADTGEGIAEADRERIFLPFERGTATSSRQGGTGAGMGLAISRQLVEMMGGALTLDSTQGRGAVFRFGILAKEVHSASARQGRDIARGRYAGRRRRLLLVDDEGRSRGILTSFLSDAGFDVVETPSGRRALEAFDVSARFDLVLTDQFMEDGDGWAVLSGTKRRSPDTPVVLISAAPPEAPVNFPAGQTFAACLMKPLDYAEMLEKIGDLLGLSFEDDQIAPPSPAAPTVPGNRPDADRLDDLRQMIEAGRVSDIVSWSEALKASEPRFAAFADAVGAAARDLDFPALTRMAT